MCLAAHARSVTNARPLEVACPTDRKFHWASTKLLGLSRSQGLPDLAALAPEGSRSWVVGGEAEGGVTQR
jgi:hypothetical protein